MDRLRRNFERDLAELPVPPSRLGRPVVTDADLVALPVAAASYFRAMGVIGRPWIRSVQARFRGRFRRSLAARWRPCEAWQYDTNVSRPTRVYDMRLELRRALPIYASDIYVMGRGRMHGKLLDLIPVVNGAGPEFDVSELVTYLSDAILLAPTLLLDEHVTWVDAGSHSFEVRLTDGERTVSGRVDLDGSGLPTTFRTSDRWCALPTGLVRAPWSTPVDGWTMVEGRPFPDGAAAVWDLPDGPFRYAEGCFDPASLVFDAPVRQLVGS